MKQKKAGRTSQRQREKRRYPFNESTKLIELIDKKYYGDVVKLTERLKPYLTDGVKGPFLLTGLFFDLEAVSGQRQYVIDELAYRAGVDRKTFYRYVKRHEDELRAMGMRPRERLPPAVVKWIVDSYGVTLDEE